MAGSHLLELAPSRLRAHSRPLSLGSEVVLAVVGWEGKGYGHAMYNVCRLMSNEWFYTYSCIAQWYCVRGEVRWCCLAARLRCLLRALPPVPGPAPRRFLGAISTFVGAFLSLTISTRNRQIYTAHRLQPPHNTQQTSYMLRLSFILSLV